MNSRDTLLRDLKELTLSTPVWRQVKMDDDPASRLLVECKMASTDLEKLTKLMYRLGCAEGCIKGAKVTACLCEL